MLSKEQHTEHSHFFVGKDFDYFLEHTMTRNKLIKIILEHESVVRSMEQRFNALSCVYSQYSSPEEVYSQIKELRLEQMRRRGSLFTVLSHCAPSEQSYLRFATDAMDYNEDNRLLRSISFYYIMQDKSVPGKFHSLLERRKCA